MSRMVSRAQMMKDELVARAASLARERLSGAKAEAAERFIRLYYANVPPDDVLGQELETLYGAALALFNFGAKRAPGAPKIRVYNPRYEDHGWHSRHMVIEIVNDDMPFLVDSTSMELNRRELTLHLVIHPVLRVKRDASGELLEIHGPHEAVQGAQGESFMHIEVDEQSAPETLEQIRDGLEAVLADVRAAVEDWRAMRAKLRESLAGLSSAPPPCPPEEVEEAKAFLAWADDEHFTYLGYREYDFVADAPPPALPTRIEVVPQTGLGVLRGEGERVFTNRRDFAALPPAVREFLLAPHVLSVNKASRRSTVHRPSALDVITVKKFGAEGKVSGERLFAGLYTSAAYASAPRHIPLLRRKVASVVARSGFEPASHDGKALQHILETFPRDELLQIGDEELFDMAMGILHLQERQRIALFLRPDPFGRFVSCLVFVPRERYSTELSQRFARILETALGGRLETLAPELGEETMLARIHLIIETEPGKRREVAPAEIEALLVEAARSWSDGLKDALIEARGEELGLRLFRRYAAAFPTDYRERFKPPHALTDIGKIEGLVQAGQIATHLYRPLEAPETELRFKIYNAGGPLALSDILPVLEDMGLRMIQEVPFLVEPRERDAVYIHDFGMQRSDGGAIDLERLRQPFQEAFARVWSGEMEGDGFNRLVLLAGLAWREIVLLRAFCKYLRQAGIPFSQAYMEDTLAHNHALARLVVERFLARFDPARQAGVEARLQALDTRIEQGLDAVESLDEDRIIRRFLNVARSALRTNYFQRAADGGPKPYLAIKLDSGTLDELPAPRPLFEITVYAPRMEGIHLRGGKVARGGIRWSDRKEDFRTEILELMKTQMVKNTVIVPVGSKGGFVVKRPPPPEAGREALMTEVVACYQTLMRGLLDLTDNVEKGVVIPPRDVVRLDADDPYLVVAADKGTATFSDIANAVSRDEYHFWLDDAFASGGSAGYDHKAMGITARGAWEGVKRHFRELGRDIQSEDFTVVGIGDMSGDVFGNGMLLSPHIKLLAAFDHRHIFIDPDPDPARSLTERRRLFDLPRSSWADYDRALLSAGGGIYERRVKSIPVSPEARHLFGIARDHLTPAELIQALLRAPIDLLWFGGIGTYVKAARESHAAAGDRSNDALRVDAETLRAKVVGEGANLGVTQSGRVAYALAGGRINTDAIDNSAGVDTSDHEVNIKILLGDVVSHGDMTMKQRDVLLQSMTEEVGQLVLRDNYLQTEALSLDEAEGTALLDEQLLLMHALEQKGLLHRAIEALPTDAALAERAASGRGLTRPELAVLMGYTKLDLYDRLLASELPDDPAYREDLLRYFPRPLREDYRAAIERHGLRREIVATHVTNSLVNRAGTAFAIALEEKSGLDVTHVARAYTVAREIMGLRELWSEIEALDNKATAATQTAMLVEIRHVIERVSQWLLAHARHPLDVAALAADYKPGVAALLAGLDLVLADEDRARLENSMRSYVQKSVPAALARKVAGLGFLVAACDILRLARSDSGQVEAVGRLHFAVGARFGIDWLRAAADALPAQGHWEKLATAAIVDDLFALQGELAARIMAASNGAPAPGDGEKANGAGGAEAIEAWIAPRADAVRRLDALLADIRSAGQPGLAMLAVANRQLRGLLAGTE
jgi:glutamate dehydrogenase